MLGSEVLRALRVLAGIFWIVAVNGLWGGFRPGRQSMVWTSGFGRGWAVQKIVSAYCRGRLRRKGSPRASARVDALRVDV